ncbi:MAG: peptidoglycan bridge formation glycyltransferase FemA/FemB family protein [Candidatus Levybacteria bacterium]|nr:peptidoglycan bridge formation glycyltransferase FemA/FemB family protein [Candidatus Levybacteria bacterium]
MREIKEIKDKKVWEDFLSKASFYPFFQSWNFGEVQKKLGRKVERFGLFDVLSKELISVFLITEIKARRGHYVHLRHGPVFLSFNPKDFKEIISFLKGKAKEKNASFIRISPLIKKEDQNESVFKQNGFINAPIHNMDAENCLVLNIQKQEEELLMEMRKTHRYLIRKAQTMNIKILRTKKLSDIDTFLSLYADLSRRKGFVPHKDLKEEFEIFCKDDQSLLLFAQYQGKIIAGALIDFVSDMAIYHHGASLDEFRHIPASYLLQWEAILEAKKRGKKFYNFWGIVPKDKPNHPWKGLTLFKTGFGGEAVEFIHAKDLPLNFNYWKTYLIEFYTKWRKGY